VARPDEEEESTMAHDRMNDFGIAIDPRTGELRGAVRHWGGGRRHRVAGRGFNWRALAIGVGVLLALLLAVFAVALISELV
jgi:hypothetical protein